MASDEGHAGAVAIAISSVQALLLINGGASVALLAFYGDALSKGPIATLDKDALKVSLILFALGVFAAALCSIFAYLSQLFWTQTRGTPGQRDERMRIVAVLWALASAGLFLSGVVAAAFAIT
jgi:hypothetical protein